MQNVTEVNQLKKLAKQGDREAQYKLGEISDGTPEWIRENGRWVAADNCGNDQNQRNVEALRWYHLAAEQGHAEAQYTLGNKYKFGEGGVECSDVEAAKWYRLAAEQGHATAQFYLAGMYQRGLRFFQLPENGVQQDYGEAARWYRLAAEQDHAEAQYNLGVLYQKGRGVPQDYILSHMWANLAAGHGVEKGEKLRKTIEKKLTLEQISEAQRLTRTWKPKKKNK